MHSFSKAEAIRYGWETFKKYPWLLVGVTLTATLLPYLIQYAFELPFQQNTEEFSPVMLIGSLISAFISIYLGIGILKFILQLIDGKKVTYQDIFSVKADEFVRYLVGSILYGLIVFAGFILLIVPGIIFGIKYQFYSYLILDKNLAPMDAIKESGKITQGHKWNIFLLNLLLGLLALLGFLALLIGIFVVTPVTWIATAFVYRKLLKEAKK